MTSQISASNGFKEENVQAGYSTTNILGGFSVTPEGPGTKSPGPPNANRHRLPEVVFAPGAVIFERLTERRAARWFRPAYAMTMFLVGALIAPTAIPLHSISGYMAYTKTLGIQQQKFENQPESQLPQIFAGTVGWEDRVKTVADYFQSLPPEQQKVTAIGASNYGDAGAVDLFGTEVRLAQGHQYCK